MYYRKKPRFLEISESSPVQSFAFSSLDGPSRFTIHIHFTPKPIIRSSDLPIPYLKKH
jgi:hypothetical protein